VPICRTQAHHDQGGRNKAVAEYLGIAPFGRIIQTLQPAVGGDAQARDRGASLPAPHAQPGDRQPQRQLQAPRQRRKIHCGQFQHQHGCQQQPQSP